MDREMNLICFVWCFKLCIQVILTCSVLLYTICIVLSVMIFLYNDHISRGISRSGYELGNKCGIMTHFLLWDHLLLLLNHWLIHLRNNYNGRHWRRDTVFTAYLVCYSLCVSGGVVVLRLLNVVLMRWICFVLCCFWDAVWVFYVLVVGGLSTSRLCLVLFTAPVSYLWMYLEPMRAPTHSGPPKQRWGKDGVSTPRLWILCLRLLILSMNSFFLGRDDGSDVLHVQLYVLLYNIFFGMISSSRMKFCMMAIYYYDLISCSPPDVTVSHLSVHFYCILYV